MVEESGTIIAVKDGKILVKTEVKSTCSHCQVRDNCGTSVIAKAFANKSEHLQYDCQQPVTLGQQVTLGIAEQTLLSASMLVYLLPLITLITAALLAYWLLPKMGLEHELWVVLTSFVATFCCFVWVSGRIKRKSNCYYQPQLLAIQPMQGSGQQQDKHSFSPRA